MKLAYSRRLIGGLAGIRVLLFSTQTLISGSSGSILKRIFPVSDPRVSILPVLDKWVEEGKTVGKVELQSLIQRMKSYRRFQHALEISQWMSDRRYFNLTESDIAIRLSLIFEVHGLEHAEKYFTSIPKQLKLVRPYGALFNCYVKGNRTEKAEALMQEMEEMGLVRDSFAYNMLVNLYARTGQYSKIDLIMEEMKRKGIHEDKFTLNNRLNASAIASDIDGMEDVLNQLEEDPNIFVDWNSYAIAASGYMRVGLTEKALAMLKKIEELVTNRRTKVAMEYLLTLYSSAGQKDEVYRIWDLMKSGERLRNGSYSCMIESLARLDDIEGAEKIFEEWEKSCTNYDFRVLNRLISAYSRKGLLEKAESVVRNAVEKVAKSGRAAYASTWNILALGYLKDKQMEKAVEMSKNSMLIGRGGWKPSYTIVTSCLNYFEEQKDVEGALEFIQLLRNTSSLNRQVYHSLLRTHVAANKPVSDVLDQMKSDDFSADEETHKIIEKMSDLQITGTSIS